MRRNVPLHLSLLLLVGCGGSTEAFPRENDGPPAVIARCEEVAFRVPPVPAGRSAELVIAVNDEVCRREPLVPGQPPPDGRLTEWCKDVVEPGGNRIEIRVVEGDCGQARARAVFACAGPEPD